MILHPRCCRATKSSKRSSRRRSACLVPKLILVVRIHQYQYQCHCQYHHHRYRNQARPRCQSQQRRPHQQSRSCGWKRPCGQRRHRQELPARGSLAVEHRPRISHDPQSCHARVALGETPRRPRLWRNLRPVFLRGLHCRWNHRGRRLGCVHLQHTSSRCRQSCRSRGPGMHNEEAGLAKAWAMEALRSS